MSPGFKFSSLKTCSPCFDEKTGRGCEKRRAGCRSDFPEWAAYELEREKEREEKLKKSKGESSYVGYMADKSRKMRGKK